MKTFIYLILSICLGLQFGNAQNILTYGDVINLQNGWNNNKGGFLDTRGYQKDYAITGNFLCVSTATNANRDKESGSWKIMSASGKKVGTPVLVNDVVYLQNQWNGNGGYLDTRGYQKDYAKTGNWLCVSTAKSSNRDNGSGKWKIQSANGAGTGTQIKNNSRIKLQNGWNNFQGGYLDTRGYQKDYAKTGNLLCVSTAKSDNRDNGSGTWKINITGSKNTLTAGQELKPAAQTFKSNEILVSANKKYMLRLQKEDGNLCIYKYNNGKQGGFVWCSMAHGFKPGKFIMQTDGNAVVYTPTKNAKWSTKTHSYYDSKFANKNNKPVKLVLENDGKLKLYSKSGAVMWSSK